MQKPTESTAYATSCPWVEKRQRYPPHERHRYPRQGLRHLQRRHRSPVYRGQTGSRGRQPWRHLQPDPHPDQHGDRTDCLATVPQAGADPARAAPPRRLPNQHRQRHQRHQPRHGLLVRQHYQQAWPQQQLQPCVSANAARLCTRRSRRRPGAAPAARSAAAPCPAAPCSPRGSRRRPCSATPLMAVTQPRTGCRGACDAARCGRRPRRRG